MSSETMGTKRTKIEMKIPTLANICLSTIASNLERYPAKPFALLAPTEFASIVKYRYESTLPKKRGTWKSCVNTGIPILDEASLRLSPCISAKVMGEIQEINPHLRDVEYIDKYVWKDCVNLRFKLLGPSRPNALRLPWPLLVSELEKICQWFHGARQEIGGDEELCWSSFYNELQRIAKVLGETPMSVKLLDITKNGKAMSKFVKTIKSSQLLSSESTTTIDSLSLSELVNRFDQILECWKCLALAKGIDGAVKAKKQQIISDQSTIIGKQRNTSDEQHRQDMIVLESVTSWSSLYKALVSREETIKRSHGQKMKDLREGIAGKRGTVKEVRVLKQVQMKRHLNGSIANNGSRMSNSITPKMSALKKQCKQISAFRAKNTPTIKKRRSFANEVASMKSKSKLNRGEVNLGNGKKMQIPTKKKLNDVMRRNRR